MMQAGRELDLLIAEKIFGLILRDTFTGEETPITSGVAIHYSSMVSNIPRFSTNIADAWLVVEKLRSMKYHETFAVVCLSDGKYATTSLMGFAGADLSSSNLSHEDGKLYDVSDTAPHAICLAAISACSAPKL